MPDGIEYQEIRAGGSSSYAAIRLCQLVTFYGAGAGLYRVDRLIGDADSPIAHTYIQFELLEPWSADAPEQPIARVSGGEGSSVPYVSARLGEEVGVLLASPTPENDHRYGLGPRSIFNDLGEGYTNGYIFAEGPVSAAELAGHVTRAIEKAGQPDCPDQPPPESEPSSDTDGVVIGEEVEGSPYTP